MVPLPPGIASQPNPQPVRSNDPAIPESFADSSASPGSLSSGGRTSSETDVQTSTDLDSLKPISIGPSLSGPSLNGPSLNEPDSRPAPSGRDPALATTIQQLELELDAARDEVNALHQMLEDLPEIFERKFKQRQRVFLDHHEHLLADNKALRERLYALTAAHDGDSPPLGRQALPSASSASSSRRDRLGRLIKGLLGRSE